MTNHTVMSSLDREYTACFFFTYLTLHSPGAFVLVFGLPVLCYLSAFLCNDISGCPVPSALSPSTLTIEALKRDIGWPEAGIWGLTSWDVSLKVVGYYALSLVLYRVLPGTEVLGPELLHGGRLKYKFNSTFHQPSP
jgi:delta14-sterol reductase